MEYYWTVQDIMNILHWSKSQSYRLITQLNNELKEKGFITARGRVPKQYAIDRLGLEKGAKA